MQTRTQQPTLQRHGQLEGFDKQRQGRRPDSPPYSAVVNNKDVASNGKDADALLTAYTTAQ